MLCHYVVTWEFWKYRLVIGFFCSLITFVHFCFLLWNDGACFVCSQADDVRALLTDAMPPVTMPPILPKGQAGSSMASSQSSSNKWAPLSFLSSWTSLPICHSLCLCWTCPAMEDSVSLEMAPLCTGRRVGLVCWLLQSVGEMGCSERERTDLLAAAKWWVNGLFRERDWFAGCCKVVGKWVVQRERERDWLAGCCKVVGKWVVQREREREDWFAGCCKVVGKWVVQRERGLICWLLQSGGEMGCSERERERGLICWLLQSGGEMGCSERETDLLAAAKWWGNGLFRERERDWLAGCCKVVGKWVVQREREREDWFAGCCKVVGKWVVQREKERGLICWLLQSGGEMGCSERERERTDLLAAAKWWGNGLFRERKREDWFAGCCKVVGKWVVQRERETDLLAAAKWWGNGLFRERKRQDWFAGCCKVVGKWVVQRERGLICWLLQSGGEMGCSERERERGLICWLLQSGGEMGCSERERLICWLLQSGGEMGCSERERERLTCWLLQSGGEMGCSEREREDWFAGCCKVVGKWVVQKERLICWLLQSGGEMGCLERLICWLLQSGGEMGCSERERETDLLAAAKWWGNGLFRERERETDLLAAAKWWGNGLFRERERERLICWLLQSGGEMGSERDWFAGCCKVLWEWVVQRERERGPICWLLQSGGEMGCSERDWFAGCCKVLWEWVVQREREINLLAAVKQQGRGV